MKIQGDEIRDARRISEVIYPQVCRLGFDQPGFSLFGYEEEISSRSFCAFLVALSQSLSEIHFRMAGVPLVSLSMSRFDQQQTTKPHRDGGPAESLLLLGYEPTSIQSRLMISDYSRAAAELGLTPAEFLEQRNPMFPAHQPQLEPFTKTLDDFDASRHQVLLINNSLGSPGSWQGVLHHAEILNPQPDQVRVINSMHLTPKNQASVQPISPTEIQQFLTDDALGREYGRSAS